MSKRGHLSSKDVTVIAVLWAQVFFSIWISALCVYTSSVFFSREQRHQKNFRNNDTWVFSLQCVAALIIAFLVDIGRLRKTAVSIIGLCLFSLTPFTALFTTMSNSLWSGMVMFWPCSVLFVTLPVTYTLMFNQHLAPNSREIRRILTILEMCNALIEWINFITLPRELSTSSRYSVVVMWVISLPLLVTLLTLLERIRTIIRGDFTVDYSVNSMIDGIRSDLRHRDHRGRSLQHVVLFLLLLLPQMSLLVIGSVLDSSPDEDAPPRDPVLVNLLFAFRLLSLPLLEVTLAMSRMNENKVDYTSLVIAHVVNIVILVVIVSSMKVVTPADAAVNVERGYSARFKRSYSFVKDIELPEPGMAAYLIINGLPKRMEIHLRTSVITPRLRIIESLLPIVGRASAPDGGIETEFSTSSPGLKKNRKDKIRWTGNRFHLFLIHFDELDPAKLFGFTQFDFLIQLLEKSQVLIVNCVKSLKPISKLHITSADGSFKKTFTPPPPTEFLQTEVPAGKTIFTLQSTDSTEESKFKDASLSSILDGYEVYVVYVTIPPSSETTGTPVEPMSTVRVFHGKPPTTTTTTTSTTTTTTTTTTSTTTTSSTTSLRPSTESSTQKPPEKEPPSPEEVTVYALAGAAISTYSVSYIHFFWMESPLRLRATMFALFRVGGALVWRLTPFVVTGDDLTATKAYSLLSLQIFTTIVHLSLGLIFNRQRHRRV